MTTQETLLAIVVLCPLVGALLNAFALRRSPVFIVCGLATLAVFIPFICSLFLFFSSLQSGGAQVSLQPFNWISLPLLQGQFTIPFGLTVDRLSALFLLVITGVGSLIHLYSGEYMVHEKRCYRFFVYLNLFVFSMLLLVLGSNMLVTFLGWEGVGVCSYLLIGYWYEERENAQAAIKAFLFNRVGDAGFLIAMFLCYMVFGTIGYADLSARIASASPEFLVHASLPITLIGFCLLLGVTGKSAQIPLYTWLPDAMAGPTPVSALIHAATMVTAGIYLMTRLSFLLVLSPSVMFTIALLGALTAFLAATIALVQTDIKKVLAYSTCSQLGYMVMACGVGAFQYGVAHVVTHAFFKACLFLGAGSVIHALHHEQDIRRMGGLFRKMPVTATTFVIATLAIIGFPGFSGFFSKDAILAAAWSSSSGGIFFWLIGWLTAGLTAFYMLRLTWLVFFGQCRASHPENICETNWVITFPLGILALFSLLGGVIAIPEAFTGHVDLITRFLQPVLTQANTILLQSHDALLHVSKGTEFMLMLASVIIVIVSGVFAVFVYQNGPNGGERFFRFFGRISVFVQDRWRVDEFYHTIIVTPLEKLGRFFSCVIDKLLIEGIINGLPQTLYVGISIVSDTRSGLVRSYLKLMFIGVLVLGLMLFL